MLADSMIAARLINGNLGAFRFNRRNPGPARVDTGDTPS